MTASHVPANASIQLGEGGGRLAPGADRRWGSQSGAPSPEGVDGPPSLPPISRARPHRAGPSLCRWQSFRSSLRPGPDVRTDIGQQAGEAGEDGNGPLRFGDHIVGGGGHGPGQVPDDGPGRTKRAPTSRARKIPAWGASVGPGPGDREGFAGNRLPGDLQHASMGPGPGSREGRPTSAWASSNRCRNAPWTPSAPPW